MSISLRILASGSSGNCALLHTSDTRILIDIGCSARRTGTLLKEAGEDLAKIDAIFITHDHGDHVEGIKGLKKYPDIPIYCNEDTAHAIQQKLKHKPRWRYFETGTDFRFRDLIISTFSVPHDAQDPVGFTFSMEQPPCQTPDGRFNIIWLPDMGHVPLHVQNRVPDADILVLEANHSPRLLQADPRRSWSTKQRIAGRHGHLSNENMAELLTSVCSPRWKHIFLTHLSRDCNTIDAVDTALAPVRERIKIPITIVPPGCGAPPIDFLDNPLNA